MIHDVDDTPYELTYSELSLYSEASLRRFAARAFQCAIADVPQCSAETLLSYIWQENTTAGFLFLLASSPALLKSSPRPSFETRIWPTAATSILLLYQDSSGIYEATYTIPDGPRSLAPITVRRAAGPSAIFPDHGDIHVGTTVLVPSRLAAATTSTSGVPHMAAMVSYNSSPADLFTRSQQCVADTLLKAARTAKEGNRLVSDLLLDTDALHILSTNPSHASTQSLYSILYTFLSTTPVQCPLSIVASLARGMTVLDPSYFIPLTDAMDDSAAKRIALQFLNHRSERNFKGRFVPLWNNTPARLQSALSSLFLLWGAIFLPDATVTAELQSIASRIFKVTKLLPHWSIQTNSYFWSLVIEQVGGILTTVGRTCMTVPDLIIRLQSVPDFIHDDRAKIRLHMIWCSAECNALQRAASHAIVPNTAWIEGDTFEHSDSDPDWDQDDVHNTSPAQSATQLDQPLRPTRLPIRRARG